MPRMFFLNPTVLPRRSETESHVSLISQSFNYWYLHHYFEDVVKSRSKMPVSRLRSGIECMSLREWTQPSNWGWQPGRHRLIRSKERIVDWVFGMALLECSSKYEVGDRFGYKYGLTCLNMTKCNSWISTPLSLPVFDSCIWVGPWSKFYQGYDQLYIARWGNIWLGFVTFGSSVLLGFRSFEELRSETIRENSVFFKVIWYQSDILRPFFDNQLAMLHSHKDNIASFVSWHMLLVVA